MDQPTELSAMTQGFPMDVSELPEIDSLENLTLSDFGNLTKLPINISWLFNISGSIDEDVLEKFQRNRRVNDGAYYALIVAYSLLIILGSTGNSLVVMAVIRKPAMRTARNVFIINLAISDLLLCLVTMPLTLVELFSQYWPLGDHPFLCKLVGPLQATSIFVSTISITAIALDRYQVIVYPTKESLKTVGAVLMLLLIWVISFMLALPNFIWRTLKHHEVNLPNLCSVNFCFEDWPTEHGRGYYSVFVILVQYCLPIITVSISYAMICRKLKRRMANSAVRSSKKGEQDGRRMKKTNTLLITIALIFCLSWLPLNLYNLVVDFYNPFGNEMETMLIVYAICHMMGMSSACSNPLMYGWLNDNFRKEFHEIFSIVLPCREPHQRGRPGQCRPNERLLAKPSKSPPKPQSKEERPMVLYTKAKETTQVNGTCASDQGEVTYITQVVTNATL
ncbi:neuropeptide F receptor [Cherax quadricarinatus]|uniref:neuropeptide F receptor n=1 Tax=Cherax quadricarinatus TaxID=27406 RepID=UPI00387EA713